jgi:hypothetical protein
LQPNKHAHSSRGLLLSQLKAASKDDEIAELEAKLQQLKEAKEIETQEDIAVATSDADDEAPLDGILSEAWKESDVGADGGGSIISSLVTILAAIVVFVLLAQIPVGQEGLDKYSTPLGPKTSTTIDLGDKNPVSRIEIN